MRDFIQPSISTSIASSSNTENEESPTATDNNQQDQAPPNQAGQAPPPIAGGTRKPGKAPKKKPALALTPEAAEISFLKQELNQAKTQITKLDTEIDDLNKTIKIQGYRLKIFEDDKNNDINSKYSDHEKDSSQPCASRNTAPVMRSTHAPCCSHTHVCCHCTGVSPHSCSSQEPKIPEGLLNKLEKLNEEVEIIKNILNSKYKESEIATPNQLTRPESTEGEDSNRMNVDDSNIETEIHVGAENISIISIEEHMPSLDIQEDLNSQVPTIQLSE